jgi:hypothetical protein
MKPPGPEDFERRAYSRRCWDIPAKLQREFRRAGAQYGGHCPSRVAARIKFSDSMAFLVRDRSRPVEGRVATHESGILINRSLELLLG